MRYAYMLLGIATLTVFAGAFVVFQKAGAPSELLIIPTGSPPMPFTLTSSVFKEGEHIPSKFTCDGENVSPELSVSGVPLGAKSLVLLMDDPDIPESVRRARGIEKFDHWVVYNIPADTTIIREGSAPGVEGLSSLGEAGYVGPCPPDREHRYFFELLALDTELTFDHTPTLAEVRDASAGHVLAEAKLTGRYNRTQNQ